MKERTVKNPMNVYFLIKSSYTPSCRLRVTDLAHILEANGITPEIDILAPTFTERRKQYRKAADFPIVVLQKRLLKWWDFRLLRRRTKFLVFDYDDAIYLKNASPSTNPEDYRSSTRKRLFSRVVNGVDSVIASTRVLAEKVEESAPGKPCVIIPSAVKMDEITAREHNRIGEKAIIGWTGTSSTFRYLDYIMPALVQIQKEYDCTYRIMANVSPDFKEIDFEFVQWEEKKEYPEIRKFDIGMMPLSEDPYSVGKAAYKLLQYMCLGVPAVCSPVGMNKDVAGDDEFALTANSNEEFVRKFKMLLDSEELRAKIATKAKSLIAEKYARNVVGIQLAETLKKWYSEQVEQ